MKLYIFACLCSLILWGVSCNEESAGIPTGSLFLGIEEDATLLTKAESAVTNESLRVDIIAAEGDTIKSYSDYIDEVKGKKIDQFIMIINLLINTFLFICFTFYGQSPV